MKKIITYSAIAAIALAAVSCTKEEMNPESAQPALKQITITVGAAEDATKSSLDGTKTINWEAGDQIGVWDGTALRVFTTEESGSFVKFTGTVDAGATELYAKYPYVSTDTWADGVVTTSIPTVQTAVTGSFAKGANVAVAKAVINGTDTTFAMKNVCSYFKFTLANGDRKVKSVTLSAQKDQASKNTPATMTGGVNITVSDTPTAVKLENGPSYYFTTLTTDDDLGLSEGDYYIAILPQTYADGISLTFTSTDGKTAFLRKSSSLTFERNTPSSFSSSIHTSSSLDWKETEVLVLDFIGTQDDKGPFVEDLADPADSTTIHTYTLRQNGKDYTFEVKALMKYSSYKFELWRGSYNKNDQGDNLCYIKLPAIEGKRLASVEMTPTTNTSKKGTAGVCEDLVQNRKWTILSNSYNMSILNRDINFGWYDLKTTAENTSYRIGNTGSLSIASSSVFNVSKITLTYVGESASTPAPNLTLDFAGNILTASVDQAGSTVYYETSTTSMEDVPTPTTSSAVLPSDGLNLAGSITYVKAIAVKGDKSSDVKGITCDGTKVIFGTSWTYDTTVVGFGQSFKRYIEKFGKEKFIDGASYSAYNLTVWNSSTEAFSAAFQYGSLRVQANDKVKHKFTVGSTGAAKLRLNISSKDPGYSKNRKLSVDLNGTSYYSESTGIPDVGEGNDPKSGWVDIDFPADKIKSGDVITIHIGYCRLYGIYWQAAE